MRQLSHMLNSFIGGVSASGNLVTRDLRVSDFDALDLRSSFRVRLTVGPNYGLSLRFDDNLEELIDAGVHGRTLAIGLVPGARVSNATLLAQIEAPALRAIGIKGAATLTVVGELASDEITARLSGASRVEADINSPSGRFALSGASHLRCRLIGKRAELRMSGASKMELAGVVDDLEVDGSGASTANLGDLPAAVAAIRLAGASKVEMTVLETATARLSGASRLRYRGSAKFEQVSVSGGSTITRI